jgi:predicted amidohydrolase
MRLGIYQFAPTRTAKTQNLRKIAAKLRQHPEVELWILPELCTTGYLFGSVTEVAALAEPFPGGPSWEFLSNLSNELQVSVILGVLESFSKSIYNGAAVFERGKYLGIYRKIHLFQNEKKWFVPGDRSAPVFTINGVKVGVMICFDWIFPEVSRSLSLRGAQILAHPANLVLPYCQNAMTTRSIENRVFSATANRVGSESLPGQPPLTFTGQSQITSPKGDRLGTLSNQEESVLSVELEPTKALDKWITPVNHLFDDRRPELY